MAGKRRQFTLEFKLEAVQLASTSKKPLAQVARELGIRPEMLRTWRRQAESRAGLAPGDVFPGNGKLTSQEEQIRRLRYELEQVKQERDFLKKAHCYTWTTSSL
ncbi:MAG: transposase [Gemmatimonadetes bacterium]|nr:transposase [Gemmatimonadota bacterium]